MEKCEDLAITAYLRRMNEIEILLDLLKKDSDKYEKKEMI